MEREANRCCGFITLIEEVLLPRNVYWNPCDKFTTCLDLSQRREEEIQNNSQGLTISKDFKVGSKKFRSLLKNTRELRYVALYLKSRITKFLK